MENQALIDNANCLEKEFQWFQKVLELRLLLYFKQGTDFKSISEITPPDLSEDPSLYAQTIRDMNISFEERLILLLGLAPHLIPQLLDLFFTKNSLYDRGYTEFGGLVGQSHSGFLPTGETALFLLTGGQLEHRFHWLSLFEDQHFFYKKNMLKLVTQKPGEPHLSGAISISQEYLTRFTTRQKLSPFLQLQFSG
jgi:hypothetical protein